MLWPHPLLTLGSNKRSISSPFTWKLDNNLVYCFNNFATHHLMMRDWGSHLCFGLLGKYHPTSKQCLKDNLIFATGDIFVFVIVLIFVFVIFFSSIHVSSSIWSNVVLWKICNGQMSPPPSSTCNSTWFSKVGQSNFLLTLFCIQSQLLCVEIFLDEVRC